MRGGCRCPAGSGFRISRPRHGKALSSAKPCGANVLPGRANGALFLSDLPNSAHEEQYAEGGLALHPGVMAEPGLATKNPREHPIRGLAIVPSADKYPFYVSPASDFGRIR